MHAHAEKFLHCGKCDMGFLLQGHVRKHCVLDLLEYVPPYQFSVSV